ncbi:hypothetical protein INT47_003086 [Mucor saturninus]|uniref:Uncharacterized protein n=1 Tax=Mucor saturninus TaxID=64648 RepID=A0A8H7QRL2_9FUNG|nr:hypothetical protein INT47_003086 [Mucor saturninus]
MAKYLDDFGGETTATTTLVISPHRCPSIEQHFKSFMLTQAFVDSCSEQSLNIKFWPYLFECLFGGNEDVFLQWGETKAADCTAEALDFKLDLRITVGIEQEQHEVATAELAKNKSTTESKLYNDKLKLALVTKCLYKGVLGSLIVIDCTVNQEHSGWCISCLVQVTARQGRKTLFLTKRWGFLPYWGLHTVFRFFNLV